MIDLEEFIKNGDTYIDNHSKETITELLEWINDNRDNLSSEAQNFIEIEISENLGAMPIWNSNKEFQDNVLSSFNKYFDHNTYFLKFFTTTYLKGLEDDGFR